MDREATFAAVADGRRVLADVLADLDDGQWATPSLCGAWDVRMVAAHLTAPWRLTPVTMAWPMIRHGGFHRANDVMTRRLARRPPQEIVAELREHAEHRFTPPGFGPEMPLTDVVVHGLDVTRPLAVDRPIPPDPARRVLDFLVTGKARRVLRSASVDDLALAATDLDWGHGTGAPVSGTTNDLVLALAGRRSGLEHLTGDGTEVLRRRLG